MTDGAVADAKSADEVYFLLERATLAIGMRLHFLLCSAISGTPPVALSYDKKVESCMSYLGVGEILNAFDFSPLELVRACHGALNSFTRGEAEEKCRKMRLLASKDWEDLRILLNKKTESPKKASAPEKFFADT